jgi:hypothetical protein
MEVILVLAIAFLPVLFVYLSAKRDSKNGTRRHSENDVLPPYYHDTSSHHNDCGSGDFGGDCGGGGGE